jgi:hypothetical protein
MNLTVYRSTNEIGGTCGELGTKNAKTLLNFGTPQDKGY